MSRFLGKDAYQIDVRDLQTLVEINPKKVKTLAAAVLRHEKIHVPSPIELSILFVNDRRIRTLNRKYLGHDWETDVLAFPVDENFSGGPVWILGEVVVSTERAIAQAKAYEENPEREIALYIVHGILHLLKYRDDTSLHYQKMWRRQDEILKKAYEGIGRFKAK